MKKSLIILMTVLTTALFAFDVGQVLRVVDGDTLVIQIKGKEERVRLLGVDTPESVHPTKPVEPGALEASAFTKQLEGSQVILTYDTNKKDFFGRVLAYVWVEHPPGRLICWNVYLIQTGHGELYDKYKFGQIEWFISQLE